jgi:drug/metabolite transporter (DMT)-like permease
LTNWKKSSTLALSSLVLVTAVWGGTFVMVQDAIGQMPVMDFLSWRFGLAVLLMIIFRPGCFKGITRRELLHGFLLGVVLGLGYISQTYGLLWASASVSGFITGMFVVLTPVMSWLILRHKIEKRMWLAVVLATFGLGLLSLHGWVVGRGEMLTLACAIFYAIHIVGLGAWSSKYETYGFTVLQLAVVAIIAILTAIPGGFTIPPNGEVWAIVAVTTVLATAVAFFIQTWAQALVSPTRAAVVMTMEPVFTGIFGVIFAGNLLTPRIIIGAICVLTAMILVQVKAGHSSTRTEI